MKLPCYVVNAFSDRLACGNPAGVVIHQDQLESDLMRDIAKDIGKSETAFLRQIGRDRFAIRWFAPMKEVGLCGHASLASMKVLNHVSACRRMAFSYSGGELIAEIDDSKTISVELPVDSYESVARDDRFDSFFGKMPIVECIRGVNTGKVVIVVDDAFDLRSLKPNFGIMKDCDGIFSNGIGVTKRSRAYDCETRYFNPWFGVDEDPVTGSVHTVIAKYIKDRTGKSRIRARQASQRPGDIDIEVFEQKVKLAGKARIVVEGTISL